MLLYLSSDEKSGLADFVEDDFQLVIKRLIGNFSLKLFVAKDMRNYVGCKFFIVDVSCIVEQLDEFIIALRSFQMMSDARIIVILSGFEGTKNYVKELTDIDVMDIVTADSAECIKNELIECLSDNGMQLYRLPRESIRQTEPTPDVRKAVPEPNEIIKYRWNCRNTKIAIAGAQRRSGVTVTAFNMAAWLIVRGANACYIEANANHHLSWIINVYDAQKRGESYNVGGIDCYFTDEVDKDYNFIIYDCGAIKEPPSMFRGADARLLCGSILPQEIQTFATVNQACKNYGALKVGLCVPLPLQEFCSASLGEDIMVAEASHDLFENNINEHIYMPIVRNFIAL